MKTILLLICAVTVLATSGCIFRDGRRGGDDRGHSDRGGHDDDHGDHGGDHHDDDHH